MPEGPKEEGRMPGEKDPTERPHHPEAPSQPGKLPGEIEPGERKFATTEEFYKALEGLPGRLIQKALGLRRQFARALKAEDRTWASHILGEMDDLVEQDPKAEKARKLMDEEFAGEVEFGKPRGKPKERKKRKEPPPKRVKPEDIEKIPDEIDQEKDEEGVLLDPRTEKMKFVEGRYFMWVEEPKRTIEEVEEHYLRYLAGIGARQLVPGQGIAGREWEEIARLTGEVDAIIRTSEDEEVIEKAKKLKRFASAYYHELEYYHRYWYGEEAGIGKEVNRCKEGSRMMLVDQFGPLLAHPEIAKAFREDKGYKSDRELIDEKEDPYGWRRIAHHLARYGLYPMRGDAYEEGVKINKIAYEETWPERVLSIDGWNRQLKKTIREFEREGEERRLTDEQKTSLDGAEWEAFQAGQNLHQRVIEILGQQLPQMTPERLRPISYLLSQGLERALNELHFDEGGRLAGFSEEDQATRLAMTLNLTLQDLALTDEQRVQIREAILEQTEQQRGIFRERHQAYRDALAEILVGFEDLEDEEKNIRRWLLADPPSKTVRFVIPDPAFGKSFEYSLYGIYYAGSWGKVTNPKEWSRLIIRDVEGRPIRDLGELGATFDMWTSPARLRLYLLNWEHIGKRNQIRLTAGRDWLVAHPETFLPKEESAELQDLLWKDRDGEDLTRAERARLMVNFSNEEIKALQEILQKQIRKERLTREERRKMNEFMDIALRNILNRDLGFDPHDEFMLEEIWKEGSQSYHEDITPNDLLTNILVEARRMEETKGDLISGEESFIAKPFFEKIHALETKRYAHLGGDKLAWIVEKQIDDLTKIASMLVIATELRRIRHSGSALFKEHREKIYDRIKEAAKEGLHAEALRRTYGIDFTSSDLHGNGASLEETMRALLLIHGEEKLKTIYAKEEWFTRVLEDVLKNERKASPDQRTRFLNRFRFWDYHTFEANIMEEVLLNARGATRKEVERIMSDRERTLFLWLAKKGMLKDTGVRAFFRSLFQPPSYKGLFIRSRDQDFWIGRERRGKARREGGRWIEGLQPETEKYENVGYVVEEEGRLVFYRTCAWEDPVQENLFDIEQKIYAQNAELLSAFLANNSAEISADVKKWLTPPMRRDEIDKLRMNIDIDDDRATALMRVHGCTDADNNIWTAKRYILGYPLSGLARKIPLVGGLMQRGIPVNLVGGATAGVTTLNAFNYIMTNTYLAGNFMAAGVFTGPIFVLSLIPASVIWRRMARLRTIPFTKRHQIWRLPLRFPFFWLLLEEERPKFE